MASHLEKLTLNAAIIESGQLATPDVVPIVHFLEIEYVSAITY